MIYCSKGDLENLAVYLLKDYQKEKYGSLTAIDIEDFATEYLKLKIQYAYISGDGETIGMRRDCNIILDISLKAEKMRGCRNFTIAHECAHDIINHQEAYQEYVVKHRNLYENQARNESFSPEDKWREWQANTVASYLLMPPELLECAYFVFVGDKKIIRYGGRYFISPNIEKLCNMCNFLGVSKKALMIRMEEANMIDDKPFAEMYENGDDLIPGRCFVWPGV